MAEAAPVPVELLPSLARDEERAAEARLRAERSRFRLQLACGLAAALALASFGIVIASMTYEARSSVMIWQPSAGAEVPQAVGEALRAEVEILQSFDVVRQALESIGVDVLYPGLEGETIGAVRAAAVARMRAALGVRTLPESSVLEVRFRHDEPERAAEVANRLVERYRRSRPELLTPAASEPYLQRRIDEQRSALAAAEAALAAFHTEHPEVADPAARTALTRRRTELEAERRAQRAALDALPLAPGPEAESLAKARARLDALEIERQRTLTTHVEGSRAVRKVENEIEIVRAYVARKEREASPATQRALAALHAREQEIDARIATLDAAERALPELERRGRELARERDAAARRLTAYQHELDAARLAADVEQRDLELGARVLEPAEAPTARIVPEADARRAWLLLGAALVVLMGALLLELLEQPRPEPRPIVWTARVEDPLAGDALAALAPGEGAAPPG